MFGGGVIQHHVQHQVHSPLFRFLHQLFKISHGPVAGIDALIIRYVIPIVILRGIEKGSQPQVINTQLFQIIQMFDHASQVAESVPIGILKRLGINLIDYFLT